MLLETGVSALPVVDEHRCLLDIYARADITKLAKGNAYNRLQWEAVTVGQALALAAPGPAAWAQSGGCAWQAAVCVTAWRSSCGGDVAPGCAAERLGVHCVLAQLSLSMVCSFGVSRVCHWLCTWHVCCRPCTTLKSSC